MSAAASNGRLETRVGVLERDGRSYLVEYLHWFGARAGHMREVDFGAVHGKRWRWLVYERDGDCVGDEATRAEALATAQAYLAGAHSEPPSIPSASQRVVGPSSRKPGAGPTEGIVYVQRERLSLAQRTARATDAWAWAAAAGPERERLKAEYERKWCGAAAAAGGSP